MRSLEDFHRYVADFRAAVQPTGRCAEWPPWLFVESWEGLVEEAEHGYGSGLYEYEHDIGVRDQLEAALTDPRMTAHEPWLVLCRDIAAADARMRKVLRDGPLVRPGRPWWWERLPAFAGSELVEDAQRLFGVQVEEREGWSDS